MTNCFEATCCDAARYGPKSKMIAFISALLAFASWPVTSPRSFCAATNFLVSLTHSAVGSFVYRTVGIASSITSPEATETLP